jgi:hypothetical protein
MHIFKILPLAALLLATPALADEVVCPSPEPLMERLCAAAGHMSAMFVAVRAGNMPVATSEAKASFLDMQFFTKNVLPKLDELRPPR